MDRQFNEKSIVHLFLPKRTPDSLENDVYQVEEDILTFVTDSFRETMDNTNFVQELTSCQVMLEKWVDVQPNAFVDQNQVETIKSELEGLELGDTLPIYIRQQNCTMLISKFENDGEEKVRVQAFRASLPSETVMSNVDSLKMSFPETSDVIENETMLKSNVFASQICEMAVEDFSVSKVEFENGWSESKIRDVPQPFLVTDWAVGILVPREDPSCISVVKKIRDQVTFSRDASESFLPFRRSGIWMSIKVALHLKLLEEFRGDQDTAKLVYKTVMLCILVDACKSYHIQKDRLDLDLASQMVAKIGRRVEKLQRLNMNSGEDDKISTRVDIMRSAVLEYTLEVLAALNEKMRNLWNEVSLPNGPLRLQPISRSNEEFKKDFVHQMSPLDEAIKNVKRLLKTPPTVGEKDMESIKTKSLRSFERLKKARYTTMQSILNAPNLQHDMNQLWIWLHDTEQFLKEINTEYPFNPMGFTSEEFFKLGQRYINDARFAYKDNPLSFSQMLLVSLKLTCILDKIAIRKHPLVREYKPNINVSSFDCLLLPHKSDIDLLNKLVDYFRIRSAGMCSRPILERGVDENSLSVRFAQQTPDMVRLKARFERDVDLQTKLKFQEVEKARGECKDIQRRIKALGECKCRYETRKEKYYCQKARKYLESETRTERVLVFTCECCKLEAELSRKRKSVPVYDQPLPTDTDLQYGVVFEFLIPPEISHLRQFLATLKFELLGEPVLNDEGVFDQRKNCTWLAYKGLQGYSHDTSPNLVVLGSTIKPKNTARPDLLFAPNESFIVNNRMNCCFFYVKNRNAIEKFQEHCTFPLTKTEDSQSYLSLQKYFSSSTSHSQNDVLTNQSDCHQKLSLNEFITFGSLRAGHRIQLRNLYMAISSRSLALEKEPVLALILQTIWQVGPRGQNGSREAHLDFQLDEFAFEFLEMLEKLVKSNELNYTSPLILLSAIFITARILELNQNCRQKCYELFKEWRELTKTWCSKIENDLRRYGSAISETKKARMQKVLHEIKMCSLSTYNIFSPGKIGRVSKDAGDIAHLLHTLSSKNLLKNESNAPVSGFMNILRFVEQMIPVRVNLDMLLSAGQGEEGLYKFIKEKFPPVRGYTDCKATKTFDWNIVMVQYSNDYYITLDALTGELLINGYPEMELSSQINRNPEFKRFFQNYLNFRVQRESSSVLRTCDPFHGKHYEFRTNGWSDLDIIEIGVEDNTRLVLVPHQKFRGLLNDHFVDNYTHWLDPVLKSVYLRRIATNDKDYDLPHEYSLTKSQIGLPIGWLFHDEVNQQFLMSINSDGFLLLTSALSRLELAKYIHVFMKNNFQFTTITALGAHLPRHNLRFILQPDGRLESLEYPGYQVSLSPTSIGTFVGLDSGVLLENGAKRNFIVPHGRIKVKSEEQEHSLHQSESDEEVNRDSNSGSIHHSCEIDLKSLSQPSFFIYEFDEVLKRLVAKKSISSWLYLVALHAVTSSSLPDPFTGITGTEMAVTILQSANVWSCSPYDKESLEILKFIKGLTPRRKYFKLYGSHKKDKDSSLKEAFETITWPWGVPSMTAYDGYAYLVNDLAKDSVRLLKLHPMQDNCSELYSKMLKDKFSEKLLLRSYLRHLSKYNDIVGVKDEVVKRLAPQFRENESRLILRAAREDLWIISMVTTAYVRHLSDNLLPHAENCLRVWKDTLVPFLFTNQPLYTSTKMEETLTLKQILNLEFRPRWLRFYSMAISETVDPHEFSIMLCALAYRGAPMDQITILHFIKVLQKWEAVEFPSVPDFKINLLLDPTHTHYDVAEIAEILLSHCDPFPRRDIDPDDHDQVAANRAEEMQYKLQVGKNCRAIARRWQDYWPCSEISRDEIVTTPDRIQIIRSEIKVGIGSRGSVKATALAEVNSKLSTWMCARRLHSFMNDVQKKLNTHIFISTSTKQPSLPTLQKVQTRVQSVKSETLPIKISDLMDQNVIDLKLVEEATAIYHHGKFEADLMEGNENWISESKQACELKIRGILAIVRENILKTVNHQILNNTGLCPRLNPLNLLRFLLITFPDHNEYVLQQYVGALGVLWANLKRFNRCLHFQLHGQQADLEKELQNPGHENWNPVNHPEWLLLELELDVMIRNVQLEVAEQMKEMPEEKNGVMQLNMGEGKTSVIVPMLCSILAKDDSLCRVTVLSSIFKMNWSILKFAIGGVLNRRLYSFPCRRDMKIDEACINDIQTIYKECMKMKGVVLTLPEYRLSFRLLAYDNILKEKAAVGLKLLETEDWLRWHARDILDESDELLSVKYRLVYTIGEQIAVDGGEVRWTVCQKVLDIVQDIALKLLETGGSNLIEYDHEKKTMAPHQFAAVRLLAANENEEFLETLERQVSEKFLAEITLRESEMKAVTEFLVQKEISSESHGKIMIQLKNDPALLQKILTLAGYIHRGILSLALSKRWRVEYGVDPKGFRRMAVPFRAKDVAAERTEFGHPDLAIILTHLSYYNSGLSDEDLEEVFTVLTRKLGAEGIYGEWIRQIPEKLVPPSLMSFHCLNLKDSFQKSELFDLIRKHKMVVDFWLSHSVFPKESKQFPSKLVMTAADLVYERQRLPTTGFSGTNDSIVHLPLTITQQDLSNLKGTNDKLEGILLQPENNGHRGLGMGATCDDILKQLKEDNLRILIDSGALMLELDNEQVAQRWLEIDSGIEAVLYFNKENDLMVKSRGGTGSRKIPDVPLDLSPFQGRLQCCGVFLDDQHTRGTDLKFPLESKACVTVGSRMKREKLLQACMRMRKLGNGHSVAFYLSNEASSKILEITGNLSTSSVLYWVKSNTKKFNDEGLLHWVMAAKNYAQRLAAEDMFHYPNFKEPMMTDNYDADRAEILAKQCEDEEVTDLFKMYGQHSRFELMTDLIYKWFACAKRKLIRANGSTPLPLSVMKRFVEMFGAVWRRCHEHVPEKLLLSSSSMVDEEQEKELELEKEAEVEEERQVERPGKLDPAKPYLHPNVVKMVVLGETFVVIDGVVRLSDIFKNTTFALEVQSNDWAVEVYATNDFISVINSSNLNRYRKTDSYLRPMEYFVSHRAPDGTLQFLFLSPFEVNELLPRIRNLGTDRPLHLFSSRRFEGQDMLLNSPRLQLPPAVLDPSSEEFCVLKSGAREMAALLLASGSLYFNNHSEQESFANFLSLVAKPWTTEKRKLFEAGMITMSGFLVPQFRREQKLVPLGFQRDPVRMVMKILSSRHPVVSDVAHVVRLLEEKTYIKFRRSQKVENDNDDAVDQLVIPMDVE